ncbi:chemotaxis protein CheA [Vibrio metschnikovii]|uniref:chemotaxis protein CheA n=1 Tax=Vibrio metschnikovii TaxID=28172 RepID=UPI00165D5D85|nr:chemotaxis protein CheA [Vibrio metschnikovii]
MDPMLLAALETYYTESRELLEGMELDLLELEAGNHQDLNERLNAIFRAAHTVKGSAGIFNLDAIVHFTHKVENLLDQLRSEQLVLTGEVISLLFRCRDHMLTLLDEAQFEQQHHADNQQISETLIEQLNAFLGEQPDVKTSDAPIKDSAPPTVEAQRFLWVKFPQSALQDGMDPLSFFAYLAKLGQIEQIIFDDSGLPQEWTDFDSENCYLSWQIALNSDAQDEEILAVFEFIRDEGEVYLFSVNQCTPALLDELQQKGMHNLEHFQACGLQLDLLSEPLIDAESPIEVQEDPVQSITQAKPVKSDAAVAKSAANEAVNREQKSLRVDAEKLDTLINLIGELVTAGAGCALQASSHADSAMQESVSRLNGLLEEVRDAALKLRMVPIGNTFIRFQRVVRDVAKELGKEIQLDIHGGDTELDKSVVEKIGDPLMHLIRNAMDHGIEMPEKRREQGKNHSGQITLNAYHDSGNIVLEIIDDGKGLDAEKLRLKAIEKGLIDEHSVLTRDEMYQLIFEPGFSMAQEVSNLSGRGVGMDVVRRNINELRGRVEIESELSIGTTVRLILPLTLAIIDGFLIEVGDEEFVVPLDAVKECVELHHPVTKQGVKVSSHLNLRGSVLPLIDLRKQFNLSKQAPRRQNVVVVQTGGQMAGLVVDRLLGELQTVIKPLGPIFENIQGISGSTILGNGDIALILDIPGLTQQMIQQESQQFALH